MPQNLKQADHNHDRGALPSANKEATHPVSFQRRILRVMIPLFILGGGIGAFVLWSEPFERAKKPPGQSRGLRTRVVELKVTDYTASVEASGIVRAHDEINLTSQVPGRIVSISPQFEDGAFFSKGEVLVQLEEADFAAAVASGEAQLAQASAGHAQEKARAAQARRNWEDLGYEDEPNELVLRLPQLREAEAKVVAAKTQLEQARRNLKRAKVVAPFDGRVRQRLAGISQAINGSTPLGKIFATDYAEVRLPISFTEMGYLKLPEGRGDSPVKVVLRDALDENNQAEWSAEIIRTEGTLDQNSLELYAIARVSDPFGIESGLPSLRIGQPVKSYIPGIVLEDVVMVPRRAVRQLKRIYIVDKVSLKVRGLDIVPLRGDEDFIIIREESISDGDLLATTPMAYVPDGAKVEIIPEPDDAELLPESGSGEVINSSLRN